MGRSRSVYVPLVVCSLLSAVGPLAHAGCIEDVRSAVKSFLSLKKTKPEPYLKYVSEGLDRGVWNGLLADVRSGDAGARHFMDVFQAATPEDRVGFFEDAKHIYSINNGRKFDGISTGIGTPSDPKYKTLGNHVSVGRLYFQDVFRAIKLSEVTSLRDLRVEFQKRRADAVMKHIEKATDWKAFESCQDCYTGTGAINLKNENAVKVAHTAEVLVRSNVDLRELPPETYTKLTAAIEGMKKAREEAYSGREALVRVLMLKEPNPYSTKGGADGKLVGTVDEIVQSSRYGIGNNGTPGWMMSRVTANIDANTSKSPLRKLYGDDARRFIFWPQSGEAREDREMGWPFAPDLDRMRVAVNAVPSKGGGYVGKTLETYIRDENGDWQPFLYTYRDGEWIPEKEFIGMPTKDACATCHRNPATGKFSPRPYALMSTPEKMLKAGYNPHFVDRLIKY